MSDRKFTAQELSDFYQRVADGEDILNETVIHKSGPNLGCYSSNWSTRPKLRGLWVIYTKMGNVHQTYESEQQAGEAFNKPFEYRIVYFEEKV